MKTCGRTRFKQRLLYEPEVSASASESPGKAVAGRTQSLKLSRKRSSSTAQITPSARIKRSCSSFKSRNSGSPIHNRVYQLIITQDPGKLIYNVSSSVTLINGLIGAIRGEKLIINIESIANLIFRV